MFSEEIFNDVSKILNCEVAAVKAVAAIESNGNGFTSEGRLVCLFECHYFYRFTNGKYAKSHPTLCYPKWDAFARAQYKKDSDDEYTQRFSVAFGLDADAAMKSCSWGAFQMMGSHYEKCGFENVGAMIDFLKESIDNHFICFANYLNHKDNATMKKALQQKNWALFARLYNGISYAKNRYDTKLQNAYSQFKKNK